MLTGESNYQSEVKIWTSNIKLYHLSESCLDYINDLLSQRNGQTYVCFEDIIADYPMMEQRINLNNYLKIEWKKNDGLPTQLQSDLKNCLQRLPNDCDMLSKDVTTADLLVNNFRGRKYIARRVDCIECVTFLPKEFMSMTIVDPPQGLTDETWDSLEYHWRADTFEKFLSSIKFHNNFIEQKRPFVIAFFTRFDLYGELVDSCNNVFKEEVEILPIIWQNTIKPLSKNKQVLRNVTRLIAMVYVGGRSQNISNETPECPDNILRAPGERSFVANGDTYHVASLPVELIVKLIRVHSNINDWIFCACSGTGSTIIAALHEERNCISMEKDPFNFQGLQIRFTTEVEFILQEPLRKACKRSLDDAESSQTAKKSKTDCSVTIDEEDEELISKQACNHSNCGEQNDLSKCDECQKLFCRSNHVIISGENRLCFQCMNR
jgi:hypothetical protein